jgi:hypothetical protein
MSWVRFSVAVAVTSLALVALGGFAVGSAVANAAPAAAFHAGFGGDAKGLPPQLAGLRDIPADQRFAHFQGVQVKLTDQQGNPATIAVTPGLVSTVSGSVLSIAGNDGATHTFALDDRTMTHGQPLATGQQVVVVSVDGTGPALAAFAVDPSGAGWERGPGGPPWARH